MKKLLLLLCIIAGPLRAQTLNRQMVMDSVWESTKLNVAYPEKALIIIHSQVQGLLFDEPNRNLKVEAVGTGDWNVYLTPGTARLKVNAAGFQQLELQPINFKRKQTYEMKISAQGFSSLSRADENLCEVSFDLDQIGVYASYGNFTPILSKSKTIAFKVPKGEYVFKFQKPGFLDEIRPLKVSASQQLTIGLLSGAGTASRMKLPGFLVVQSNPPGAEIVVNGQKIGTTPLQVDLVAGNYQLELRKPLYYPDASLFDVKENETKEITRTMRPRSGFLTITSNPAGASVYLDEKFVGTTPFERRSVESGKHMLRVDMPLYHAVSQPIVIADGEQRSAAVTLLPAFGSLTIASAPEDSADVYIDNARVGVTPYHNERMPSGKYVLRVTKPLFNDVEEDLAVVDGIPMKRTVVLGRNFGELFITAPEQTIYVNDQRVGTGTYSARLAPGTYAVRAERGDAYEPDQRDVFLSIGEPVSVALNAAPRLATVSVVAEPFDARGAEIYVNNEFKGKAPISFPLIIGTHSIVARSANFLDAFQGVTLTEGEQKKVTLTLTTYEGSRQSSIDAWGRSKWISAGAALLATAAAVYCQNQSDTYYDTYKTAVTSDAAQTAREKSTNFSTYAGVALGTAIAGGAFAVVSWIWQSTY